MGDQPPVAIALGLLSSESVKILNFGRSYQTPAFPPTSGPDFVNGAVLVSTTLSRTELLAHLHEIERKVGRTRNKRWEPRVVDLDLIDYAGQVAPDEVIFREWFDLPLDQQMQRAPEQLILPHPRLQDRPFVLVPMRDIVPNWVHPVTELSLNQMLARFSAEELTEIQPITEPDSTS